MKAHIKIASDGQPVPKTGLVGAMAGGTEPGGQDVIEVDLSGIENEATLLSAVATVAQAYVTAFVDELEVEEEGPRGITIEPGAIVIDSPFAIPEPSQGGTEPFVPYESTDEDHVAALPNGSIVLDSDLDGYRRTDGGWRRGDNDYSTDRLVRQYGPALVVYVAPEEQG